MANLFQPIMCGVDVSMDTLDIACSEQGVQNIPNTQDAITQWLGELPPGSCIALESTGSFHEALLESACEAGFNVYVLNGRQVRHYREAVGPRAKTDRHDARLLRRYLCSERARLKPAKSLNFQQKRLWQLLKRRAMLVKTKTQLRLSTRADPEFKSMTQGLIQELEATIRQLERQMLSLLKAQGWEEEFGHCQSIPGIGQLNALALVTCFHRGDFQSVDQFIAYLGLDVRVKDSGRSRGKRKLTKRGEPELRRLLYNAAMASARHPAYRPWIEGLLSRGLSVTAVYVALSRKLARIAFALIRKGEDFALEG